MKISPEITSAILKKLRDFCENTACEACPFREFKRRVPKGIAPLNSFCEFGFEALYPLLPCEWPVEDWDKDSKALEEELETKEEDMVLRWLRRSKEPYVRRDPYFEKGGKQC